MPRLLAQKTLICSISSDLCSLLSRYSQNTPDMLKVFQFILHRFSFERFLKIVFKLGIKMKVCFAVDGTAISEGAFDCKYYFNVHDRSWQAPLSGPVYRCGTSPKDVDSRPCSRTSLFSRIDVLGGLVLLSVLVRDISIQNNIESLRSWTSFNGPADLSVENRTSE